MVLPSLVLANLKMIFRNRQALFWALGFPLIFVAVFGLFNLDEPPNSTIAVVDYAQDGLSQELLRRLDALETITIEQREDEAQARQALRDGDLSYLLVIPEGLAPSVGGGTPRTLTFLYDRGNPSAGLVIGVVERFLNETNLALAGQPPLLRLDAQEVQARQLDYFDFLLPGLVGMGVMTYSIIGLASVISVFREQRILKRILATPLRTRSFFAGLVIAYLILSLVQATIILAAGMLFFGGKVYGSMLQMGLIVLLANLVFLNLGFIVGAFAKNVNAASGLGNAVAMPMLFLSGVFFPTDSLPPILSTLVQYLPLAPMVDLLRGVALDARPFWDFPGELLILGLWIVVSAGIAVRVFRFD